MSQFRLVPIALIIALSASSVACASEPDESDVVAIANGETILYGHIDCGIRLKRDSPECIRSEQAQLARRFLEGAIEAAADVYELELTDSEKAELDRLVAKHLPHSLQLAEHQRQLDLAVLRVHEGEDMEAVAADLERVGVQRMFLEGELKRTRNRRQAQVKVGLDRFAAVEDGVNRFWRRQVLQRKLEALVRREAAARAVPFVVQERRMWSEVLATRDFRILDPRYQMPELGGYLDEAERSLSR